MINWFYRQLEEDSQNNIYKGGENMTLYEIIDEIGYLCDTHDIIFEVNKWGLYIRKYFYYDSKPCNFNQSFSFEILKYRDLDDCVLEFERGLEKELSEMKGE